MHYKLEKYRKRDGKLSYARLCCRKCGLDKKRSKHFVDRDENAAKKILLVGRSLERPACFKRGFPAPNYLSVDTGGPSSDLSSAVAGVVESL